jgi:hypothetical protein
MKRRNAIILFGIVAIVAMIAIVVAAEREDHGTRAGETYIGYQGANCTICHAQNVANWSETDHADIDGDFQDKHGTNVYNDSYCGPCHTLGWGEVSLGGFDSTPGEWNSTHNQNMWMIQCENCHGPASGHLAAANDDASKIASINLDRDPYISCYGTPDAGCHSGTRQWGTDTIPGWNASAHAPHTNDPETDSGMNTYCARCKSPSQWDPTTSYGTGVDIPKAEYRGITCGDCHNPHNDTGHIGQLRWDEEESCDVCHNGGHHETMRTEELEGEPSVLREDYPYMEDVSCVECHMFQTGRSVPEPWKMVGHSFEPSIEACVECHTDVYDSLPDVAYNVSNASNMAEWNAWEVTLDQALEEWEGVVNASQLRHDELLEEVTHLIEEVEEIMEIAEGNDTWTEEMEHDWEQAEYDWELADHASRGAHNPAYATALLNSAKEGLEGILEELEMGTIKGRVTDESDAAMADVFVYVNGEGVKTDADGMYMVHVEAGTYSLSAFKKGNAEYSASGIEIVGAQVIVQNFTLAPDADHDGTADSTDTDDDNDGYADTVDAFPNDPTEWLDTDNDTIGNNEDTDDDGDGVVDTDDKDPLDGEITTKISDLGEEEEADTTMFIVLILVLIVIIVVLLVLMMRKSAAPKPQPEPEPEPPMEEETEEEE